MIFFYLKYYYTVILFIFQSNYAMQYKAGVAPPRVKGPKRQSEYAMQFTWKKGVMASPLLDAEQVQTVAYILIILAV